MKRLTLIACAALFILGCLQPLRAQDANPPANNSSFQRDVGYEQLLRINASPDNTLTPLRVLRWINSLLGNVSTNRPSNTEFQPVVNAHDGRVRIVAQIAFKF